MIFKYLRRPKYKDHNKKWREPSIYHVLAEDGVTAVCGFAQDGVNGFVIVLKERKVLQSMTCINCRVRKAPPK